MKWHRSLHKSQRRESISAGKKKRGCTTELHSYLKCLRQQDKKCLMPSGFLTHKTISSRKSFSIFFSVSFLRASGFPPLSKVCIWYSSIPLRARRLCFSRFYSLTLSAPRSSVHHQVARKQADSSVTAQPTPHSAGIFDQTRSFGAKCLLFKEY